MMRSLLLLLLSMEGIERRREGRREWRKERQTEGRTRGEEREEEEGVHISDYVMQ